MNTSSPFRDQVGLRAILRVCIWRIRRIFILLRSRGKVRMGHHVVFGRNADIRPYRQGTIGSYVAIGKNFTAETDFVLGDEILISSNVSLVSRDHSFDDPDVPIFWQGRVDGHEVTIAGNNLIGFGVILVGPCRVGKGAVVGAGSIVVSDLPDNTVCAGAPARVIRTRIPL